MTALLCCAVHLRSRDGPINRRHVYTEQIYQSPACTYIQSRSINRRHAYTEQIASNTYWKPSGPRLAKFSVFNTKFIVFDAQFMVFNTKFMIFNTKVMTFNTKFMILWGDSLWDPEPCHPPVRTQTKTQSESRCVFLLGEVDGFCTQIDGFCITNDRAPQHS